jgi:hypothetical protein
MKFVFSVLTATALLFGAVAAQAQAFDPSSGFGVGSGASPGIIGSAPGGAAPGTMSTVPGQPTQSAGAAPGTSGGLSYVPGESIGAAPSTGGSPTYDPNAPLPSIGDTGAGGMTYGSGG